MAANAGAGKEPPIRMVVISLPGVLTIPVCSVFPVNRDFEQSDLFKLFGSMNASRYVCWIYRRLPAGDLPTEANPVWEHKFVARAHELPRGMEMPPLMYYMPPDKFETYTKILFKIGNREAIMAEARDHLLLHAQDRIRLQLARDRILPDARAGGPVGACEVNGSVYKVFYRMSSVLYIPVCTVLPNSREFERTPMFIFLRDLFHKEQVACTCRRVPDEGLPAEANPVWEHKFVVREHELPDGAVLPSFMYYMSPDMFVAYLEILTREGDQASAAAEARRYLLDAASDPTRQTLAHERFLPRERPGVIAGPMEVDDVPPRVPLSSSSSSSQPVFGGLSSEVRPVRPSRRERARVAAGKRPVQDSDAPSSSSSEDDSSSSDDGRAPISHRRLSATRNRRR